MVHRLHNLKTTEKDYHPFPLDSGNDIKLLHMKNSLKCSSECHCVCKDLSQYRKCHNRGNTILILNDLKIF